MRWQFADPDNASERDFRRETLRKIDSFWQYFETNSGKMQAPTDLEAVSQTLNDELCQIAPFGWSLLPHQGEHQFVLNAPLARTHLGFMNEVVLEKAPQIPHFSFLPYRGPLPEASIESTHAALFSQMLQGDPAGDRLKHWISDIRVKVTQLELNLVELTFVSSEFVGRDNKYDRGYCYALSECLLGQEDTKMWTAVSTEFVKPGRFFRASEGYLKLADLPERFKSIRQAILNGRLAQPVWQSKLPTSAAMQSKDHNKRRIINSTSLPYVLMSAEVPFSSERFSRSGETFCYLMEDCEDSQAPDDRGRHAMEDVFDKALRKASLGCVTGGGWGPAHNFIDFALTDVFAAIPILQQVSRDLNLSKKTWLKFLDEKWRSEWVGMYPDAPEPPLSPDW